MTATQPTDPGPFQKYLFSAACYVQVGQCYTELLDNWDRLMRGSAPDDLVQRLAAAWREAFERQMVIAGGLTRLLPADEQAAFDRDVLAFREQADSAGLDAMAEMLDNLPGRDEAPPDFVAFFRTWAIACDGVYAGLVRSEPFAALLGRVVNGCIALHAGGGDR